MGNRGFIHFLVLIVIIMVVLAYLNVDLRGTWAYVTSLPWVQHTWAVTTAYWSQYIGPAFPWALAYLIGHVPTAASSTPTHY